MNKTLVYILFLICANYVCRVNCRRLKSVIGSNNDLVADEDYVQAVNSTVAKIVTKFSCIVENEEAELLVYGTKAWSFPEQDINFTLTYPAEPYQGVDDYVITGFKVLLFVDTVRTRGYISDGGLFEDHVTLSFVSPAVNMLFYQFWLYGIPKTQATHEQTVIVYDMC